MPELSVEEVWLERTPMIPAELPAGIEVLDSGTTAAELAVAAPLPTLVGAVVEPASKLDTKLSSEPPRESPVVVVAAATAEDEVSTFAADSDVEDGLSEVVVSTLTAESDVDDLTGVVVATFTADSEVDVFSDVVASTFTADSEVEDFSDVVGSTFAADSDVAGATGLVVSARTADWDVVVSLAVVELVVLTLAVVVADAGTTGGGDAFSAVFAVAL